MALASPEDVAAALGRSLTTAETEQAPTLLDEASDLVIGYLGCDPGPSGVDDVTLTWPDGSAIALSRAGDVVTAIASPGDSNALPSALMELPVAFAPAGFAYHVAFASLPAATPGRYLIQVIEDGVTATIGFVVAGQPGPFPAFTSQWVADPVESVPEAVSRVVARMVARVFGQAGQVPGSEGTTETVGPFSQTVRFASGTTSGAPWLTVTDKVALRPYRCGGGMRAVPLATMQTGRYRRYV